MTLTEMSLNDTLSSSTSQDDSSSSSSAPLGLGLSRIRLIMKSSPGTLSVSQEALFTMAKCTEAFVQKLAQKSLDERRQDKKQVDYRDLANYVQNCDDVDFLQEIIPHKVRAGDVLEQLQENPEKS